MITDLDELPDAQTYSVSVCVVGAGAAGISMALELAEAGKHVVLLESGGMGEELPTQRLYAGEVVNQRLHSPPDKYRQRRFGGTTTIWGGRCMPFDPIDFEQRSFVPFSGWPISFGDLEGYYPRANRLCEAGEFAYQASSALVSSSRPMIVGFNAEHFTTDTLERFSCPTDFGVRYAQRLRKSEHVQVILHANVTGIVLNEAGNAVIRLNARSLRGRSVSVQAEHFVLATGGLETPRLLLANNIGNDRDVVGRYYMCHLAGAIGALRINRPLSDIWHGYDIADDGVYCRRRIALRPEVQRAQGIGNFIARLHHPRITRPEHRSAVLSLLFLAKPFIPYEYAKRLHGDEESSFADWLSHVRNVAVRPFDAVGFALHMLRDRALAERKFPSIIIKPRAPLFSLDFHAEQEPNPSSRITLAGSLDSLGVPRIRVDWRYTQGDVATVRKSLALLADDVRQNGCGTFDYDPQSVELEMTRYGAYGGHHIGTARMGTDRATSVVDQNCKLHDISNLYVAGAAVFPTSSQANPTLTVVALALRLAKHLRALT